MNNCVVSLNILGYAKRRFAYLLCGLKSRTKTTYIIFCINFPNIINP